MPFEIMLSSYHLLIQDTLCLIIMAKPFSMILVLHAISCIFYITILYIDVHNIPMTNKSVMIFISVSKNMYSSSPWI